MALVVVSERCNRGNWVGRGESMVGESLVPTEGGEGVVASGFGLWTGASEGWGGGVAR